jgi:hypothetical protein
VAVDGEVILNGNLPERVWHLKGEHILVEWD